MQYALAHISYVGESTWTLLTRYRTVQKLRIKQNGERKWREDVRTLICSIDSVLLETCGAIPLVKWERAISTVGMPGREMETESERMKAEKRKKNTGRKW
jgi:hypothetical protein